MVSLDNFFGKDSGIIRDTDLQLLLLANIIPPMGSGVISPVLDSLTTPYGVSEVEIGLMVSVFTAPAIVMIPVAGILADRYGRKPIMIGGLVLFGIMGTGMMLTTDFRIALALRLVQGIGFAGVAPTIITSIGDLYKDAEEATAQGLRFTASGLSQTVFPLLAGGLVIIAWQYPFLLNAIAIPIAVLMYFWFREPIEAAESSPDSDDQRPDGGTDADDSRQGTNLQDLVRLALQRRVLAVLIARGFPSVVWLGFLTYNSILIVRVMDGTPLQAGMLVAIGSLTWAGAASQAGRVMARFGGWMYPLVGSNLLLGGGVALIAVSPSFALGAVGIGLAGAGFGITLALYRSLITQFAPATLRGGLVSLGEAFGRVTATLIPIVMGASIAVLEPAVGGQPAIRLTILGVAVLGAGVGVICIVAANASPPVRSPAG